MSSKKKKNPKDVEGGLESYKKDQAAKKEPSKKEESGGGGEYIKGMVFSGGGGGSKKGDIENKFLSPEATQFKPAQPSSFHKGGRVRKSGVADVEKGEEVLTAKEAKKYREMKKKHKISGSIGGRNRTRKASHKKRLGAKKMAVKKG